MTALAVWRKTVGTDPVPYLYNAWSRIIGPSSAGSTVMSGDCFSSLIDLSLILPHFRASPSSVAHRLRESREVCLSEPSAVRWSVIEHQSGGGIDRLVGQTLPRYRGHAADPARLKPFCLRGVLSDFGSVKKPNNGVNCRDHDGANT